MLNEHKIYNDLYRSIVIDSKITFLGQILQRAARCYPDRVALIFKQRYVTYAQLYYYASRLRVLLKARGINPGDKVLLLFENSIEFYVGYFGILQSGAIAVPLNTFLKQRELEHIISDAQPAFIISSKELQRRLLNNGIDDLPPIITEDDMVIEGKCHENIEDFQVDTLPFEDTAVLLYTSGTTGLPKGVMLSSKNAIINVIQTVARFGLVGYERGLAVLPLFHSFAQNTCIWSTFLMFCTVIVVPRIERRSIRESLEHKPTIFLGVPALYGLICLLKNANLASVKYFFSGGDALSDKIRSAFSLVYGRKICSGYGMTETSPVIAVDMDDVIEQTNTVGRPLVGIEVVIRNEKGNTISDGEVGEIWLRGDNVMRGYYHAPELTREVLVDGWLRTGDLGYFDKNRKLVISGRIKDLIIHKGLNIYPQEIENVILVHPDIIAVGVVGKKDESGGEVPVAFVQIKKSATVDEATLRKLCVQQLASYKVPRSFVCMTRALVLTATGKVDKKILRAKLYESKK